MLGRTDLATEAAGNVVGLTDEDIRTDSRRENDITVQHMQVQTAHAARELGKPEGLYVTVELPSLTDDETKMTAAAELVAAELTALLPRSGSVLVVGLGNRAVTPDALGPDTADMVLATRHIEGEFARTVGLDSLRPTAVLAPGVLGKTGAESSEILRGVCRELEPAAVIAVDALAARSMSRLGCTVQLCDTGIAPGSGVGNNRRPLTRETLGVPVIGIGVPTVVDALTIAREFAGTFSREDESLFLSGCGMMVTPREIDVLIRRAARLIALAINGALHPDYPPLELTALAES